MNNIVNELLSRIANLEREVERLENIINEFEKWLEEKSIIDYGCSATIVHEQMALSWALKYLQELRGSNDNG